LRALNPGQRYADLAVALGRYVDGLVFSDGGANPPERSREELLNEAEDFLTDLAAVEPASRRAWLEAQLKALRVVARGDDLGIREEAQALYTLGPRRRSESDFAAAHQSLDALLPGSGALASRYWRWLDETSIPGE